MGQRHITVVVSDNEENDSTSDSGKKELRNVEVVCSELGLRWLLRKVNEAVNPPIDSVGVPEPEYNVYGQMQCHACGCYSDIICPVHLHNENGRWISLLCTLCEEAKPRRCVDRIGEPLKAKPPPYP